MDKKEQQQRQVGQKIGSGKSASSISSPSERVMSSSVKSKASPSPFKKSKRAHVVTETKQLPAFKVSQVAFARAPGDPPTSTRGRERAGACFLPSAHIAT